MSTPTDSELLGPAEYAASRRVVFPSPTSFRWFERQHRDELVQCGALLKPAGRFLVDPLRFDQAVREIGGRLAAVKPK